MFTSDNDLFPPLEVRKYDTIGNVDFGVHGVKKQLKQLNVWKSTGPAGIPAQVLSHEIAPMLSFLFQQS